MAKLCAGQMTRNMCQDFGLEHIWVRVLSTYGSGDNRNTLVSVVIQKLMNKECPALTAGEQVWDYLYAGDAAEAFYRIAISGHNGAVYVLGSGKTKFLREFMEIIRDEIDPDLPLGIGKIPYYKDQAMHLEADISALTRDTGWRPAVDFKEGIQAILAEYKSHR
jgi:nucleoside-diphosphate-sugar epimerase